MEHGREIKAYLKKINRQGIQNIAAAASLKLLIAAGFLAALWFLRSYSVDSCLLTLREETKELEENIHQQITYAGERLEMLADIIKDEEELTSGRAARILQSGADIGKGMDMVSRLGIVLPDSRILNEDGSVSRPVNGITFDELAKKGSFITGIEPDNAKPGQSVLFLNVPVERKGRIEGILFGVIEPQALPGHFKVDIFEGNADIFIVDTRNMEFIMDTLHGRAENTGALKGHKIKKGYSEEQLERNLAEAKGGVTAYFSSSLGEYLYTAYEPAHINEWFVMLTVPESTVFKETVYIEKVLFWLGLYEVLVLAAYFLWDITRTRREIRAKEKMATTDLLTNLKNRNAYEQVLAQYEAALPARLSCVYADANGLHELNNSQGHAAGDKMLRTVADAFAESFGQEGVYRIGGDEFLVFAEMDIEDASRKALAAKEKVKEAGYHVSVGTAAGEESVAADVKAAEQRMYEDKRRYYTEHGDRRRGGAR